MRTARKTAARDAFDNSLADVREMLNRLTRAVNQAEYEGHTEVTHYGHVGSMNLVCSELMQTLMSMELGEYGSEEEYTEKLRSELNAKHKRTARSR